jgi:putative transposon-encoded protein
MRKIKMISKTEITVKGIEGFLKRMVTPFGNGAKVDCPKEYLGKEVYLIIKKEKES